PPGGNRAIGAPGGLAGVVDRGTLRGGAVLRRAAAALGWGAGGADSQVGELYQGRGAGLSGGGYVSAAARTERWAVAYQADHGHRLSRPGVERAGQLRAGLRQVRPAGDGWGGLRRGH